MRCVRERCIDLVGKHLMDKEPQVFAIGGRTAFDLVSRPESCSSEGGIDPG
jgi:hypothetical protein